MPRGLGKARDERRRGDSRPLRSDPRVSLTFLAAHGEPFRFLPRHGEPLCVGEWLSQLVVKAVAWWPAYLCIVTTLTLVAVLKGGTF